MKNIKNENEKYGKHLASSTFSPQTAARPPPAAQATPSTRYSIPIGFCITKSSVLNPSSNASQTPASLAAGRKSAHLLFLRPSRGHILTIRRTAPDALSSSSYPLAYRQEIQSPRGALDIDAECALAIQHVDGFLADLSTDPQNVRPRPQMHVVVRAYVILSAAVRRILTGETAEMSRCCGELFHKVVDGLTWLHKQLRVDVIAQF
ncbi:hypothetical protein F5B19DRAFT_490715 [Rostrohypoxylon terebratum]|nr:hypothetical protein F5B19DRAFT_490715 [Rostrohypoxylon terebratum]